MSDAGVTVSFERLVVARASLRGRRRPAAPSVARPGGLSGRRRGAGLEIHDVRPFGEGDDLRHADPAVTARTGRLHVRTFHAEEDRSALLVADFRRPMLWGTRERLRSVAAAEALAVVGWQVAEAGGKVGSLAVRHDGTDYLAPRDRERGMIRVAAHLERSHRLAIEGIRAAGAASISLSRILERVARLVPPGAAIVCATGLDDPGADFASVAGTLVRKRRLFVLLVRDAIEATPPPGPLAYFGDEGRIEQGWLDAEARLDERSKLLTEIGATVHVVRADEDVLSLADLEIG